MSNGFQSRVIEPRITTGLNSTGSTISKGYIVKRTTTAENIVLCSAATDAILGVAMADIPDGEYGDIQTHGTAIVMFAAAQTIGARVAPDANGKAAAASTGNAVLGIAREAGGTDTLAEVELAGPGGLTMP